MSGVADLFGRQIVFDLIAYIYVKLKLCGIYKVVTIKKFIFVVKDTTSLIMY